MSNRLFKSLLVKVFIEDHVRFTTETFKSLTDKRFNRYSYLCSLKLSAGKTQWVYRVPCSTVYNISMECVQYSLNYVRIRISTSVLLWQGYIVNPTCNSTTVSDMVLCVHCTMSVIYLKIHDHNFSLKV